MFFFVATLLKTCLSQLETGQAPFPEMETNPQVIRGIAEGIRLQIPDEASRIRLPPVIWPLVGQCWSDFPGLRPSAS